jgi:hypothetical protein
MLLQIAGSLGDVPLLGALVSADKKQHKPVSFYGKIDAISRTVINPKFPDSFINRLMVSEVPQTCTVKTGTDFCPAAYVSQGFQPILERRFSLRGFVIIYFVRECLYSHILAYKLQSDKKVSIKQVD